MCVSLDCESRLVWLERTPVDKAKHKNPGSYWEIILHNVHVTYHLCFIDWSSRKRGWRWGEGGLENVSSERIPPAGDASVCRGNVPDSVVKFNVM